MSKRALIVGLAMLAVGIYCAEASDKEAEHALLKAGARIRYYEARGEYGTDIKVGNNYYVSHSGQYSTASTQFVLAFMRLTNGERSNERIERLRCALFPVRNETIFDAEDKAKFREFLMSVSVNSVGLKAIEYGRGRELGRPTTRFRSYYAYTFKNGKTLYYEAE